MMDRINNYTLKSNRQMSVSFDGGTLSSDSGLLLVKEFMDAMGFNEILRYRFHTLDSSIRFHTDYKNLLQTIYQIIGAYFADDRADDLQGDPIFLACLEKGKLASQPTLSRFFNRMEETTLKQFEQINKLMRKAVYSLPGNRPNQMIFDLDTTLLPTYGEQEGSAWNYHYQAEGYHPQVCFNGLTGELLRAVLREGTDYCCKNVTDFLEPLFKEFTEDYSYTNILVRGDSGFACPELYEQCERYHALYVIRLKYNTVLKELAAPIAKRLDEKTSQDKIGYAVEYGEFQYQANSWDIPRRVVCKVEKPYDNLVYQYTFIVTNMTNTHSEATPETVVKIYCKRGTMENYIKEGKNGFDFSATSSASMVVNANRLQIHAIAYNIINWMRLYVFPTVMKKDRIDTIRLKLFKVASRVVVHAHKIQYKLCSSFPYKEEFLTIMEKIHLLRPVKCR